MGIKQITCKLQAKSFIKVINEHVYRFNQIDKNYFSDRCAKIEAMSSRDSDQNLYKVQDCTTFFSYTPSQGSIFVLWSKKTQEGSTPGAATDSGRSSFPR